MNPTAWILLLAVGFAVLENGTAKTAFYAYKNLGEDVDASSPVKFEWEVLDEGNCYDETKGVFAAQLDGMYLFSATIVTNVSRTDAEIVKSGEDGVMTVGKIRSDASGTGDRLNASASNTVLVKLLKGETVWVRMGEGTGSCVHGNGTSSFSGHMIHSLENVVPTAFHYQKLTYESVGKNTIKFENKLLDEGNAYDTQTGNYIAPVDGMYVFSATIVTNGSRTDAEIVKNDMLVGKIRSDASGTTGDKSFSSASNTVFLRLVSGDSVSVRISNGTGYVVGEGWSSFAGSMVPLESEAAKTSSPAYKTLRRAMGLSNIKERELQSECNEYGTESGALTSSGNDAPVMIAFHAHKKLPEKLPESSTIKFEQELLDEGNCYNNEGEFVAPRSGMYMFSATIVTNRTDAEIIRNGVSVGRLRSDARGITTGGRGTTTLEGGSATGGAGTATGGAGTATGGAGTTIGGMIYSSASNTVILRLCRGDTVWVRIGRGSSSFVDGDGWSSFTGCLIGNMPVS